MSSNDPGRQTSQRPFVIVSFLPSWDSRAEIETLHSITSSAANCKVCGTLRPSVLAALRFMTSS